MGRLFFACDSVPLVSGIWVEVDAVGCDGEDVRALEFLPLCPI